MSCVSRCLNGGCFVTLCSRISAFLAILGRFLPVVALVLVIVLTETTSTTTFSARSARNISHDDCCGGIKRRLKLHPSNSSMSRSNSPTSVAIRTLQMISNTTYDERVVAHNRVILNRSLADRDAYSQVILAYRDRLPLDEEPIRELLDKVGSGSSNSDFAIVVLIRLLFLTRNSTMSDFYQSLMLPTLQSETYWYSTDQVNDDTMNSENHMILWMSSAWLLQEGYAAGTNRQPNDDKTLRQRLTHFLQLKRDYGYYEFLSITYLPLTLGALLNLVDFAVNVEMAALAESALRRLVSDYLLFVNSVGVHFTAAGRDYAERFTSRPYSSPMDGIVYLLTGLSGGGQWETSETDFINFMTTSAIRFEDELAAWNSSVDTTYTFGHTLSESFDINRNLDKYDRIVFQFSQGAYTHPAVIADTIDFIQHYGPIKFKSGFSLDGSLVPSFIADDKGSDIATLLKQLTYGSVNSGGSVRLYRQMGAMLTSIDNFWPGFVGGQTYPWMAVVNEVPVWTQSGRVKRSWLRKSGFIANTHLPRVLQEGNAALIVYKPNKPMPLSIFADVALHWRERKFDETKTVSSGDSDAGLFGSLWAWTIQLVTLGRKARVGSWILGRRGDSYVAVYRPCGDNKQKGWYACSGVFGRQVWAVVVGDATRYGSFKAFADVIGTAKVSHEFRRRQRLGLFRRTKPVYTTSLTVEAVNIRHEW